MVYRIHFEPRGGYWCIQFHIYLLLWSTVKAPLPDSKKLGILKFDTLREAEDHVAARGIDVAYHRVPVTSNVAAVAAGGVV